MRLRTLAAMTLVAASVAAQERCQDNYQMWRDYVAPKPAELAWLKIPWRNNLWDAVIEANEKEARSALDDERTSSRLRLRQRCHRQTV